PLDPVSPTDAGSFVAAFYLIEGFLGKGVSNMRLNKILALALSAVLAASLAACGGSSSAVSSTASSAAGASAGAPDGDGDPTTLTVAMECAYAPYNWTQPNDANG